MDEKPVAPPVSAFASSYDDWLEAWGSSFDGRGRALDLGCGPGFDTEVLLRWGYAVTTCDISENELGASRARNPGAKHIIADARDLSRFGNATFDAAVASLSLHYFDRDGTHRAFAEVARVLRPGGVFAFRVNADDDFEHGAPLRDSVPRWGTVFHNGWTKQFFTEDMVRELLAGRFTERVLERSTTDRFAKRKSFLACLTVRETESPPDAAQSLQPRPI